MSQIPPCLSKALINWIENYQLYMEADIWDKEPNTYVNFSAACEDLANAWVEYQLREGCDDGI